MTIDRSLALPGPNASVLTRSVLQSRARASSASVRVIGEPPTITRCGTGSTASM